MFLLRGNIKKMLFFNLLKKNAMKQNFSNSKKPPTCPVDYWTIPGIALTEEKRKKLGWMILRFMVRVFRGKLELI